MNKHISIWLYVFYLFGGLLFSMTTNAQNTVTLSQAITNGLANKKNIVAGKLDVTISNLQTKVLFKKYLPQVSAEYSYLYNPILQTSIFPIGVFNPSYPIDATQSVQFGTKWTQSAGLTAYQPLLDKSIQTHINESKLQERIAALSQQQLEEELAYKIAQTYIKICLQEARINSAIADTIRTYISHVIIKDRFEEKRLLKSDLNKSKINHNNAVQVLNDGIVQQIEDKVYLLFLMGVNELDKWDFEVDTTFYTEYSKNRSLDQIKIEQLPELQKLGLQSQLTGLQTKSERSKHLPTIGLKGYLGANQFTNTFNPVEANTWFGFSYVGLNIKVPILFGEGSHNKIQQLKMQADQYNLQVEDKKLQYSKDVLTAKLKMDNLKTQLKTQEENISLSTESIYIFQARVTEGQESALNLNFEESGLLILKADFETNKQQFWVYWLDNLKASGQLSILWN